MHAIEQRLPSSRRFSTTEATFVLVVHFTLNYVVWLVEFPMETTVAILICVLPADKLIPYSAFHCSQSIPAGRVLTHPCLGEDADKFDSILSDTFWGPPSQRVRLFCVLQCTVVMFTVLRGRVVSERGIAFRIILYRRVAGGEIITLICETVAWITSA